MAVEIKELVIRGVVRPEGERREDSRQTQERPLADERAAIVEEAVREVLRILKTSKER